MQRLLQIVSVGVALIGLATPDHSLALPLCERLPRGSYIGDQSLLWSSLAKESPPVLQEVNAEFHGPNRIYIALFQEAAPGKTRLLVRDDQKRTVRLEVSAK